MVFIKFWRCGVERIYFRLITTISKELSVFLNHSTGFLRFTCEASHLRKPVVQPQSSPSLPPIQL